ncbi:SAM-dependent DNA methyltransferase [Henriciella barbarensis]|uniref:site-specific DNA-methyltransferase (adenine-specific) n=1 Tax=Henriciella barbarensis TaxID=86342 RepID=A0A399QPY6_9PROT|nr:class I SAM-dependent DNA methyltransferase [Henriciella barbarensis]RIJ20551.1 SAM-dependent DNA methyltransferase [Henriciella barbarensis]
MNPSSDLVNKLWRLCAILRKDGITYQQYVTELTYLLFLKMMHEQGREDDFLPEKYRWSTITAREGIDQLTHYRRLLTELGDPENKLPRRVSAIFDNASTFLREPVNLAKLVSSIDALDWYSADRDSFGDLYEGLLQKNAEETKKGAGQYFTPRVLIEAMVELMDPQPGEVIQDPALGTGGFIIAADTHIRRKTDDYLDLTEKQQVFQTRNAYHGIENVPGTYRLLLMNLHLHGVDSDHVLLADSLSPAGASLSKADLILTNPPFGPAGGRPTRDDLTITHSVSSYQLPFVEHCLRSLKPGGRAAIVVPDNVLFEDGKGKQLRQKIMDEANLHTILRLPTGIFYAQGVKTNVIFLEKADEGASKTTQEVWVYDMRANMPAFGKTAPLTPEHLKPFVEAYAAEARQDEGEEGRFRCFTREAIEARGDNLDITWLRDESETEEIGEPEDIAAAIMSELQIAMAAIETLTAELEGEDEDALVAAE